MDIALASVGLIFAAPLIAVIVLLVRRESPGDGLFRQLRVGRNEEEFICYKIRSMRIDAPNVATHLAPAVAITRLGLTIRRVKLDELPQLWNVLKGDMSLVGPRPCLPDQVELIAERRKTGVFMIRPGITGLAQVEGVDMSEPQVLAERDAEYVARRSLGLDVKLICRTVFGHRH